MLQSCVCVFHPEFLLVAQTSLLELPCLSYARKTAAQVVMKIPETEERHEHNLCKEFIDNSKYLVEKQTPWLFTVYNLVYPSVKISPAISWV